MDIDPTVTLRVPANSAFVALIRAAVSAMCARLDFTIDRIEDVKLAVDEAAALLLSDAPVGTDLDVRFTPDAPDGMRVDAGGRIVGSSRDGVRRGRRATPR